MKTIQKLTARLLLLTMAAILLSAPASAAGNSWGMFFRHDGQPPEVDRPPDWLAQYDAVYLGDTTQKVLYLTFDAGYENGFMPSILDTLKRHDVPAAFFIVGHYVNSNPELVRRMCAEGHIVGNHTYHHPDMSKITDPAVFNRELESLADAFKEATGQEMSHFYRPPEGNYSENNLKLAKQLGYKTVFWSLAYQDWQRNAQPSHEAAFKKLMPRTHPGAIVLLHSTSKTNAEILDELLNRWKAEGYRFGRLDELFRA